MVYLFIYLALLFMHNYIFIYKNFIHKDLYFLLSYS